MQEQEEKVKRLTENIVRELKEEKATIEEVYRIIENVGSQAYCRREKILSTTLF